MGLGGMTWSATSPCDPQTRLIRPLLDVPRDDIEAFARSNGLAWREDATNFDLSIPRNRIRHELVPLLLGSYCPGLRTTVPRTMEILRADAEHVAEADARSQSGSQPSLAQLRAAAREALQMAGRPVNFRNVEARIESKTAFPGKQRPPGTLRHGRHKAWRVILNSDPRRVRTGALRVSWAFRRDPLPFAVGAGRYEQFDADVVGDPVELRHWRPGDRFQMLGKRQASKLQDLFTGRKIPPAERHERMVALDSAGRVFWVEGLPPGEVQKLTTTTRRILVWKWDRSPQ